MANPKMRTNVSILYGETGANVTPVKLNPGKKRNMKLTEMSSPSNYPIPNQDINWLITKKDPSLQPIKSKHPPVFIPLFNDAHDPKVQKMTLMILQIIHVMRNNIL